MLIRNDADGKKYLYDIFINANREQTTSASNQINDSAVTSSAPDKDNIPHKKNIVNSQYMQNQKNNSEKTEMQLALEKAGIDKNTFSNRANSINSLTPEQRQAMQEAEKAAEAKEKNKAIARLQEQNEYLRRELSKTEAGKIERKAIKRAARDFAKARANGCQAA